MTPFHDGMNHWQRQWLSDRLHRKSHNTPQATAFIPPSIERVKPEQKPKKDPDIARALRLKPDASKALAWLDRTVHKSNPDLVTVLLASIPADQINNTPRKSSAALEQFVNKSYFPYGWNSTRDAEHLKCVELLLNAGAHWNPPTENLRYCRRAIMGHDSSYIVQLLRLLFRAPNAVNTEQFLELCRSQALEAKIAISDSALIRELKDLRKSTKQL